MPLHFSLLFRRLLLLLAILPGAIQAGEISLAMPGNLKALADYQLGDPDKPAVLVLHGFLQTHHFSTVRLITTELAEAGYTVLSPTLTLNIDQRGSSLTCDAVQSHTVEQATDEIATWVEWLKQHGYTQIVLIGHSTGSNNLLSYLQSNPDEAIAALIATSAAPMDGGDDPAENRRQRTEARLDVARGRSGLKRYTLGFCQKNYTAAPLYFLSYMQWDRERILNDLISSPVPTTVVLGEFDKWLPEDWLDTLRQREIAVRTIAEANHYFSGTSEFDFQSTILSLVQAASSQSGR